MLWLEHDQVERYEFRQDFVLTCMNADEKKGDLRMRSFERKIFYQTLPPAAFDVVVSGVWPEIFEAKLRLNNDFE